jgi:hypothetical protein
VIQLFSHTYVFLSGGGLVGDCTGTGVLFVLASKSDSRLSSSSITSVDAMFGSSRFVISERQDETLNERSNQVQFGDFEKEDSAQGEVATKNLLIGANVFRETLSR